MKNYASSIIFRMCTLNPAPDFQTYTIECSTYEPFRSKTHRVRFAAQAGSRDLPGDNLLRELDEVLLVQQR